MNESFNKMSEACRTMVPIQIYSGGFWFVEECCRVCRSVHVNESRHTMNGQHEITLQTQIHCSMLQYDTAECCSMLRNVAECIAECM